jgi:hypothetical protein
MPLSAINKQIPALKSNYHTQWITSSKQEESKGNFIDWSHNQVQDGDTLKSLTVSIRQIST